MREIYGRKTLSIQPFCKLAICTNKIPKWDVDDKAMKDRISLVPFYARFLTKEEEKIEKKQDMYDPEKYTYYPADKDFIEKYKTPGRNIDIFMSWLVDGCSKCYQLGKDGIEKPKVVQDYINKKYEENDILQQWIQERCEVKTF